MPAFSERAWNSSDGIRASIGSEKDSGRVRGAETLRASDPSATRCILAQRVTRRCALPCGLVRTRNLSKMDSLGQNEMLGPAHRSSAGSSAGAPCAPCARAPLILRVHDETVMGGLVLRESDTEIAIVDAAGETMVVAKKDIASRSRHHGRGCPRISTTCSRPANSRIGWLSSWSVAESTSNGAPRRNRGEPPRSRSPDHIQPGPRESGSNALCRYRSGLAQAKLSACPPAAATERSISASEDSSRSVVACPRG